MKQSIFDKTIRIFFAAAVGFAGITIPSPLNKEDQTSLQLASPAVEECLKIRGSFYSANKKVRDFNDELVLSRIFLTEEIRIGITQRKQELRRRTGDLAVRYRNLMCKQVLKRNG